MNETLPIVTIAAATFILAGFVKGVVGLGLPTVAIGILGLVMTTSKAASLLVVPSLVTNLWQIAGPGLWGLARRLWPLLAMICVGTWAGFAVLPREEPAWAGAALGLTLVLYAALGLASVRFSVAVASERWLSPLIGFGTGLVTAATGVFVVPAVPYIQALGLERDDLVQALGLSFTASTLALAAGLISKGSVPPSLAGASVMALAPALLGMGLGQWVRGFVRPATFRACFFLGLLALGTHLLLRPFL